MKRRAVPTVLSRALVVRLREAAEDRTYRDIGRRTHIHPETVRRFMYTGRPSAEFIASFCSEFSISPTWLLLGHGPKAINLPAEPRVVVMGRAEKQSPR